MRTKICNYCKIEKSTESFHKGGKREGEFRGRCKDCMKLYPKSSKESQRSAQLKYRFGISASAWDSIFILQNSACAICLSTKSGGKGWHTDHDHACCSGRKSCGECVRGILCFACNSVVGHVENGWPLTLPEIEAYLALYKERQET